MSPKAFISYSWSSAGHQTQVRQWAEQLVSDGVEIVIDIWDLQEGDDKYAFMERMVTDKSVTHVLVFSDAEYAAKADARKAGVGTESQIISQEVYAKVQQSKFIPIVCEFDGDGEPCLPAFLKTRIWIDFSNPEAANNNWEKLVRLLYGKPAHEKPTLGKAPAYVLVDSGAPASPAVAKFVALRQAVLQNKRGLSLYRQDFLDACIDYADSLRIRVRPEVSNFGERVLEDCGKLKLVRDHIVDWVLLEANVTSEEEFTEALVLLLERLLELKSRPPELNSWNEAWLEAHSVFVYETFLYIIAALLKRDAFSALHTVLTTHYLLPGTMDSGVNGFCTFGAFFGRSEMLQAVLAPQGRKLLSPAAELIKRQADRQDLPFAAVMEAELLVLLMALIAPDIRWYPQTLFYASRWGHFPFFLHAAIHRNFLKLALITGIDSAEALRAAVIEGQKRLNLYRLHTWMDRSFWEALNLDAMDTLQ